MISIKDNKDCCGCGACIQRCPKRCITLHEDYEGFLYPKVDIQSCIDCHLCEKVCPEIRRNQSRNALEVFAAINTDEAIRMQSSSGGIFTILAEKIIEKGGVVFGASFDDNWTVVHSYAETKAELAKFRGSKYVQSKIGNMFKKAEVFLKEGRWVLFSGTPCQIAGLKNFLRRDYTNLLTVDFICHGVPSPGVFRTYLQERINEAAALEGGVRNTVLPPCIPLVPESDGLDYKGMEIKSITFRDKRNGWKKFGFALVLSKATAEGEGNSVLPSYSTMYEDYFLRGFLCDLYLRPSCHACPVKGLRSGSDIELGDWWGIASLLPEIDDDKGISAVIVNTEKGRTALHETEAELYEVPYDKLVKRNPALVKSGAIPRNRSKFFKNDGLTFKDKIEKLGKAPFSLKGFIIKCLIRIVPKDVIAKAKNIRND